MLTVFRHVRFHRGRGADDPLDFAAALFALALVFFLATSAYALSNYYFDPAYAKAPDWRALGKLISTQQKPGDIIVQNYNEMSAIYYRSGTLPVVTIPKDFWPTPDDEKSLEQVNRDYDRIWFLPASPDAWDPNHFSERYLQRHDQRLMDTQIAPLRLQLYSTPRQFTAKLIPVNARVGQATLVGYKIDGVGSDPQVPAHSTLVLRLYWRPIEKTGKDLRVFVHLVDATDRLVLQQDGIPAEGSWPTPEWLPGELIVDTYRLTTDAAPGAYSLFAGMYDPASMVRAPVSDANGVAQPSDRALIVKVTVTP